MENGRRYHAFNSTKYYQPNDEIAQEHIDLCHALCLRTFDNKSHLAPLGPNIQKALDVGTGTGIWAIDFADEFPSAQVIGTDLSPIQPSWAGAFARPTAAISALMMVARFAGLRLE